MATKKALYTDNTTTEYPDGTSGLYVKDKPFAGEGSEYVGPNPSEAGAGRGKQGGPTAKELKAYEDKQNEGIYTAEKGKPPTDPEGRKKGGAIRSASSRADGIAQRGKTRGTMVMCGGGMTKRK